MFSVFFLLFMSQPISVQDSIPHGTYIVRFQCINEGKIISDKLQLR